MKAASRKGFTLIEILIVVIILGILAAIVIPQFTNASNDAKLSAVKSTVQSVRGQIELYKLQHNDRFPTTDGKNTAATWDWTLLTSKTDAAGTGAVANGPFGPYLQEVPKNSLNGGTAVAAAAAANGSWVFDTDGKFWGVDTAGAAVGQ